MDLLERDIFLETLQSKFDSVKKDGGHCVFINGEAGLGKTSLVKVFCERIADEAAVYQGFCDALFTPRPMAPLVDVAMQLQAEGVETKFNFADRTEFFSNLFLALGSIRKTVVLVFEDIHWADESTLDFVKFLARRISKISCFFILTYRDNEIHSHLGNVTGQLPPDSFSRLRLTPLSREAVQKLALRRGYPADELYAITEGNPFYVNEILASYNIGIPENIKDSILSVYLRGDELRRGLWQLLSVVPTGLEIPYLEKLAPGAEQALQDCLAMKVLIQEGRTLRFKHELYRRTIENSLSPLLRIRLNRKVVDSLRESFEQNNELERIVHHAKNANEHDIVVQYAPLAARHAAQVGSHLEASKLLYSAIEYYQGNDVRKQIELYESYAFECYLTNQFREAVIYQGKALALRKELNEPAKTGESMRMLSRLWWFMGDRKQAKFYAEEAIKLFEPLKPSCEKAMAYSSMSQLMLCPGTVDKCIYWGEKAKAMAREIGDDKTYYHAVINVASAKFDKEELLQALEASLKGGYQENIARAYANLAWNEIRMEDYESAAKTVEEGIRYCEGRDLGSWAFYIWSWKVRMLMETGRWKEAMEIAERILNDENQMPVVTMDIQTVVATIKMRRGETGALRLLENAKIKAFQIEEYYRIVPVIAAFLEYEWLTGSVILSDADLNRALVLPENHEYDFDPGELSYWLRKTRGKTLKYANAKPGTMLSKKSESSRTAADFEKLGRPYEKALKLFEGTDNDKRKALTILQALGANAVYEKLKSEMRLTGIRQIPRGLRKTTLSNQALLTSRELDILGLLKTGLQNKEIASKLYISAKTVDHHISAILFKLDVNSRVKAVQEAVTRGILK